MDKPILSRAVAAEQASVLAISIFAAVHGSGNGTDSPFAALHKSDSYRGFICRVFTIARPVSFDPDRTLSVDFAALQRQTLNPV